jgi:hypothetical protein
MYTDRITTTHMQADLIPSLLHMKAVTTLDPLPFVTPDIQLEFPPSIGQKDRGEASNLRLENLGTAGFSAKYAMMRSGNYISLHQVIPTCSHTEWERTIVPFIFVKRSCNGIISNYTWHIH